MDQAGAEEQDRSISSGTEWETDRVEKGQGWTRPYLTTNIPRIERKPQSVTSVERSLCGCRKKGKERGRKDPSEDPLRVLHRRKVQEGEISVERKRVSRDP